jgi:hypothetical protein
LHALSCTNPIIFDISLVTAGATAIIDNYYGVLRVDEVPTVLTDVMISVTPLVTAAIHHAVLLYAT